MSDNIYKTFTSSPAEMNRRKAAFRTLLVCLFISAGGMALVILPVSRMLIISTMGIIGAFFLVLAVVFDRILERSKNIIITVSDNEITRSGMRKGGKCVISSITNIRAKRTTAGQIREMKISHHGGTPVYINGIEAPDALLKHLCSLTDDRVNVDEVKEPIDLDHPLFYVFFGSITGSVSVVAMKLLMFMKPAQFKLYRYSLVGFLAAVGTYWFFRKPSTGRYGRKGAFFDYLFLLFLIVAGIAVIVAD